MKTSAASIAAAIALGMALWVVPTVQAVDEPQPHPRLLRLQQRLGLSEDQTRAIREIHQRQHESWQRIAQALRRAHQELRQLALGGADDATIQAKVGEVGRLRDDALRLRVRTLRELAPILSPEQREKLGQAGWWGAGPRGPHRQRS